MDIIVAYDTNIEVESRFTPDLLGEILSEHIPRFMDWVSMPDEDDPMGERWTPEWFDISEAIAELDRSLQPETLERIDIAGFSMEDIKEELDLFRAELVEAGRHTQRFYLSMY